MWMIRQRIFSIQTKRDKNVRLKFTQAMKFMTLCQRKQGSGEYVAAQVEDTG